MVVETKSPTTRQTIIAGWQNPTNAFASDDVRMDNNTVDGAQEAFGGYGINIPADATLNSFKVQVEGYDDTPSMWETQVDVWDGTAWRALDVFDFSGTETTVELDASVWINTVAKANAVQNPNSKKVRIQSKLAAGGCFPPDAEFLTFPLGLVRADEIIAGQRLWGCDEKPDPPGFWLNWRPLTVTNVIKHDDGALRELVRLFVMLPPRLVKKYYDYPRFRELFNVSNPEVPLLADTTATSNHPILLRNRGRMTYGDVRTGDSLGEIVFDVDRQKWYCVGARVIRIDRSPYTGPCYDIQHDGTYMFGRHLLAHLVKQ